MFTPSPMELETTDEQSLSLRDDGKLRDPVRHRRGGLPSDIKRAKISPIDKSSMRERILKICMAKTKKSRAQYISRIRQGRISSIDLAREILDTTVANESSHPFDFDLAVMESSNCHHTDFIAEEMGEEDEEDEIDPDLFQKMMSDIYDDICRELTEELNIDYYDAEGADEIDWEQLEDFDIPADQLVLCPFCKRYGMDTDFLTFECRCRCGSSFSFAHRAKEEINLETLRGIFAGVHERHNSICCPVSSYNPGLTLEFQINNYELHAWCGECGYHESVI